MADFQTSYSDAPSAGAAGLRVNARRDDYIETFAAEGAIDFGAPCVSGTDDETQVKMGVGTLRGVAVRTSVFSQRTDGTSGYDDKSSVNVLRKGMIWVPIMENVANDGAVTRITSGGDLGKWGTATGTAVPNAVWRGDGTSGGFAKLELVLPAVVS